MSKRLWNDRRGVAAWMVGAAILPVIGMASLGTEVGSWHVIRRQAQNTADAAAIAGATSVMNNPTGDYVAAGQAFATSNGFAKGAGCGSATNGRNVCITSPSGGSGLGTTVQAVVTSYQTPILAQWFVPAGNVRIQATAVATIQQRPGYCAFALQSLDLSGSTDLYGGCGLATNGTFAPPPAGQNPFHVTGANTWTVGAAGACTGNTNKCNLGNEVKSYSYNTGTPIALPPSLNTLMNGSVVPTQPSGQITTITTKPTPSASWQAKGLVVPAGTTMTLDPGLYLFPSLTVDGTLAGPGVNIIIGSGGFGDSHDGSNAGTGSIQMTAGTAGGSALANAMNGVLIYDLEGKGAGSVPTVKFAGTYTSNFNGGVYFPYAHITYRGGSGLTGCMVIVADILDFGGNSSMDMSGCNNGNIVPPTNVVMLTN